MTKLTLILQSWHKYLRTSRMEKSLNRYQKIMIFGARQSNIGIPSGWMIILIDQVQIMVNQDGNSLSMKKMLFVKILEMIFFAKNKGLTNRNLKNYLFRYWKSLDPRNRSHVDPKKKLFRIISFKIFAQEIIYHF